MYLETIPNQGQDLRRLSNQRFSTNTCHISRDAGISSASRSNHRRQFYRNVSVFVDDAKRLHNGSISFLRTLVVLVIVLHDYSPKILTMGVVNVRTLSREIQTRIIAGCGSADLKALRLTSRYWEQLAATHLFSSLTIYPQSDSLTKIVCISKADRLRHFVHDLQYDGSILTSAGQPGVDIDNVSLSQYLGCAFPDLPDLRRISIIDSSYHGGELLQERNSSRSKLSEVAQSTGVLCDGKQWYGCITSHVCSILRALHQLPQPVEILGVQGFFWSRLLCSNSLAQHENIFDKTFSSLRSLHLEPVSQSIFFSPINMPDLQFVLRQAENLEALHVDFGMVQCGTTGEARSMFSARASHLIPPINSAQSSIARLSWSPRLTTLHLRGLVCTSNELLSILFECAPTLRSLSLEDLTVVPESSGSPHACLVAVLKWMKVNMNLHQATFRGYMSNEGLQQWAISDLEPDKDSILARVESFVVNGGSCPLDHVSIEAGYFDLARQSVLSPIADQFFDDPQVQGDGSWRMAYDTDDAGDWSGSEDESEDDLMDGIINEVQVIAV